MASELVIQGRDSAALLEAVLRGASPPLPDGAQELAAEVLRSFDRALAALSSGEVEYAGGGAKKRKMDSAPTVPMKSRRMASSAEAPLRIEKNKTMQDGFIWRKYGQKEILHCKYPRLYFRCSYKNDQNCKATRQVQQSEEDPSVYVITYFGEHTCSDATMDEASQPFVIKFGSSTPSSAIPNGDSPFWSLLQQQNFRNEEVQSEISQGCSSSSSELQAQLHKVAELEESAQTAELMGSSSSDICYASPGLESSNSCLDWEFGESLFYFHDFINFDQIDLFQ